LPRWKPGCSAAFPRPDFAVRCAAGGGRGAPVCRARADRFEREADAFFNRVRQAYLDRAQADPRRIRVLDARHSIAELQAEISQLLQGLT